MFVPHISGTGRNANSCRLLVLLAFVLEASGGSLTVYAGYCRVKTFVVVALFRVVDNVRVFPSAETWYVLVPSTCPFAFMVVSTVRSSIRRAETMSAFADRVSA